MRYRAHIQSGRVVLHEEMNLPDGTPVFVQTLDSLPRDNRSPISYGIAMGIWVGLVATLLIMVIAGIIFNVIGIRERVIEILIPALMLICGVTVGTIAGVGAHRLRLESQRRAAGQCLRCGYDIRATPDRCPECGRRARRTKPQ